jgi:hypothetical protein
MTSLNPMVVLALSVVWLLVGCSPAHKEPIPTDQQLIDYLQHHEKDFAKLGSDHTNKELLSKHGIDWTKSIRSGMFFRVWYKDFAGPGGCMKGYFYGELPSTALVDSIDADTRPCGPEQKTLFRHIQGNWYIMYASHH